LRCLDAWGVTNKQPISLAALDLDDPSVEHRLRFGTM
jgi:hypothetical protein